MHQQAPLRSRGRRGRGQRWPVLALGRGRDAATQASPAASSVVVIATRRSRPYPPARVTPRAHTSRPDLSRFSMLAHDNAHLQDTAARSPDLIAAQRSFLAPDVVTRSLLRSFAPPLLRSAVPFPRSSAPPCCLIQADRSCAAPPLTCPFLLVLTREWDQVGGTLFAPDLVPRPTPPPVSAGQRGRSAGRPLAGGPAWTPAPPRDLTWAPEPPNGNGRVGREGAPW